MQLKRPLKMGVLNGTPDSFSDGGKFNSPDDFLQQFQNLEHLCDIVDIGVESTAPFNHPIQGDVERHRLSELLSSEILSSAVQLSFDTYRPETMKWIIEKFKLRDKNVIWNDVSGVWDNEVIEILETFPKLEYVFSQTFVTDRKQTSDHMSFAKDFGPDDFFNSVEDSFHKISTEMATRGWSARVWFDPCFGFSKNRSQNHWLLQRLPELIKKFSKQQKWLIGVSRKSFLRYPEVFCDKSELISSTELLQMGLIGALSHLSCEYQLAYRMHDPISMKVMDVMSDMTPLFFD